MERQNDPEQFARDLVAYYTLVASGTGMAPYPAASAALVAENGMLLVHIGSVFGTQVTKEYVGEAFGMAGAINVAGRSVFVEIGKAVAWGTGQWWTLPALMAAGATTAGVQTYMVGLIAIEIARNGGETPPPDKVREMIATARETYSEFLKKAKERDLGHVKGHIDSEEDDDSREGDGNSTKGGD
jgi:hypothetical protein